MADWMIGDSDDTVSIVTEPSGSGRAKMVQRVGSGIRRTPSPPPNPVPGIARTPTTRNFATETVTPVLVQADKQNTFKPSHCEPKCKSVKRVTWKDDIENIKTCHYRRLRGARGTLIRSKSKVSSGRLTRYYTIGFYDIETGRDEYASFNQKQLLSDTDSLPDVDTSVIFDALRMMDTSVLCDGIRHTWMAENVRVAPHCFTYSTYAASPVGGELYMSQDLCLDL